MNILIISGPETGGAGNAAKNLHEGLLQIGADSHFLSEKDIAGTGNSFWGRIRQWWQIRRNIKRNYSYLKDAPTGFDHFSFARTGYQNIHRHPMVQNADVINIHWVSYMLDYKSFFKHINKPVIWTLHDTSPFTGGCHYTFGCENFTTNCANCIQLAEPVRHFAAKENLLLKQRSLKDLLAQHTAVVSPSVWLKSLSEKSALFKRFTHFHVPNGIDTAIFKQCDQAESRLKASLPANKFIVLFVGTSIAEYRKGFDAILQVKELLKNQPDIQFVAVGKSEIEYEGILNLGYLTNKGDIALAYNAADVFIIPSREDNLPNTVLESLCCGTPVIGYKTGGITDAIDHGKNGFLVNKEDTTTISGHIIQMINHPDLFNRADISATARAKYSLKKQAQTYLQIIDQVLVLNQ